MRNGAAAKYRATPKGRAAGLARQARYRARPETKAGELARRATIAGRAQQLLKCSKAGAKRDGREHTITLADIVIPEFCPVYGLRLDCAAPARAPNLPSLDRVDNTKGYVPGNVRVISWKANCDKSDLSQDEILALAAYVQSHRGTP